MKKLTLLLLSLGSISTTYASGLIKAAGPPAYVRPLVAKPATVRMVRHTKPLSPPPGYMGSMQMIAGNGVPHPGRAENSVISQSTYFRFSSYGPYGVAEPVNVTVLSTNANAQLHTGFDEEMNVWLITFDNTVVDPNDDAAEALISVSDQYGDTTEYFITWPRTAWW
jgi:hypothetical protein